MQFVLHLPKRSLTPTTSSPLVRRQLQFSEEIDSIPTQFSVTNFDDRLMLVITQRDKLGVLTSATCDVPIELDREPTYTIRTLLGQRDDSASFLICRQLAPVVNKPLLLSLSLSTAPSSEPNFDHLKRIVQLVISRIAPDQASSQQSS